MKRLTIVSDSFYPRWDGIVRFIFSILPKLKKEFEVTLLVADFGKNRNMIKNKSLKLLLEDVNIVYVPIRKKEINGYPIPRYCFFKIFKVIKNSDIVFSQTLGPIGQVSIFWSKILNKKSFSYLHSVDWLLLSHSVDRIKKQVMKISKFLSFIFYNLVDLVLVPSSEVSYLLKKNKIFRSKVMHLGVDLKDFKKGYERNDLFESSKEEFIIGYVGRFAKEKSLKTLYLAFKRFRKEYPAKLVLVGDGDLKIKNFFKKKEDVVLMGQRDDVNKIYSIFDVFVLPSLLETTSLVTLEAMASGVPVVVTPVGYVKYYVTNYKNGLIFPMNNSYFLFKRLEELYLDRGLRKKLSKNAYVTVESLFDFEKNSQKIVDFMVERAYGNGN